MSNGDSPILKACPDCQVQVGADDWHRFDDVYRCYACDHAARDDKRAAMLGFHLARIAANLSGIALQLERLQEQRTEREPIAPRGSWVRDSRKLVHEIRAAFVQVAEARMVRYMADHLADVEAWIRDVETRHGGSHE